MGFWNQISTRTPPEKRQSSIREVSERRQHIASVCAGSSPQPLQPLGVYVYPLPEDIPHNESFYNEGYEQYATELVIPQLLRGSIHAEADPHRASLFLVPNQGVRGCEPSRFAVRTRLCSCCHR